MEFKNLYFFCFFSKFLQLFFAFSRCFISYTCNMVRHFLATNPLRGQSSRTGSLSEKMATLAIGATHTQSLVLCARRFFPTIFVCRHQENSEVCSSKVLKSCVVTMASKLLRDWLPSNTIDLFWKTGMLLAVPKKRVSHSRKRIRNHPKFPKNRTDIEICVVCRNQKLQGHLCGVCLERIRAETEVVQEKWPGYDLPQPMSR